MGVNGGLSYTSQSHSESGVGLDSQTLLFCIYRFYLGFGPQQLVFPSSRQTGKQAALFASAVPQPD